LAPCSAGLIGKLASAGNAALYVEMARRLGPGVPIYGVPVQGREWLGVLHLKGFVIDDSLLYSGASINDVYLYRQDRYRLDRYHLIENRPLADSMASLLTRILQVECGGMPSQYRVAAKNACSARCDCQASPASCEKSLPHRCRGYRQRRSGNHAAARFR
jgi:hypothetical protein